VVIVRLTVGKVTIRPRPIGKVATVLQMALVLWILLNWGGSFGVGWLKYISLGTGICTGLSGLLYVWDGMRQLSLHPSSSPTKK
jgi:phosphatidylglycerophosphate synthase